MLGAGKPVDSSVPRSSQVLPKAPSSKSSSSVSDSLTPETPSKGSMGNTSKGKKKKRREILMKADAAGHCDVKHADVDGTERGTVAVEDDRKNKSELDEWGDVVEITKPELKTSENRALVDGVGATKKHEDECGGDKVVSKKSYSRGFLLTCSKRCTDLPLGSEISYDVAEILKSAPEAASYLVNNDSLTSGTPSKGCKGNTSRGKKKKRREILMKANAATHCDVKHADVDGTGRGTVAVEDDGKNKSEPDDWGDVVEITKPELKTSEIRDRVDGTGATKHDDEYGDKVMSKKRYSRDFLLTFLKQCIGLPLGFEIRSDVVDILISAPVAASYLVHHDSHIDSERIIDRPTGGFHLECHGAGLVVDDDEWGKAPGSFALDVSHRGMPINFQPGQAGNYGVLRNAPVQSSSQHQNPDEEDVEALCKLMSTVGEMIDHPKAKEHMDAYFDMMLKLSSDQKLSSSISFMLKDAIDLVKNKWEQRRKVEGPKTIEAPQSPLQVMHRAERRYEVGNVSHEGDAKQRQLKAILNKLTPQNFEKLFEQVKEVNIDSANTLVGVISQIFDKALMEPTFCEMYADFCCHLAGASPYFFEDNEKITFKRLLVNKCQEEFERREREQAEANTLEKEGKIKQFDEEREEKKVQARRRWLGNIQLIAGLYKKKMLTERIMHECIKKLLGQYQNPDEEDIEALCKLMSTTGERIDHPKAKEHMDAYFDMMLKLSNSHKLSSRVRFMLKDAIDLRNNQWKQSR